MLTNTDPALRRSFHAVALSTDVRDEPVSVQLLGEHWVLVRLGGRISAFPDQCPHRRAPLSAGCVVGDQLQCGYHGWRFDADGRCAAIPALIDTDAVPTRAHLSPAAAVEEADGFIFMAPEAPRTRVLSVPDAFGDGFQHGYLGPVRAKVGAGLMIDNFLDMAHFPFVHAATIGTDEEVAFEMDIARDGFEMVVRSEHLFPNREDPLVQTGERPLLQRRRLTYTYVAPFSISLRIDYVDAGGTNILSFHAQPEDDDTCRIYTLVARNDVDDINEAVEFERKVIEEDLVVQERYRDKRLPLDPTIEVHTKVDKVTLELRRILRDLVAAE